MEPLRILQVSASDRMGGAERVARALHEGFRKAGHRSWMAVGTKTTRDGDVFEIGHDARRSGRARACNAIARALNPVAGVKGVKRVQLMLRETLGQPARTAARNRGEEDFDFPGTAELLSLTPERPEVLHLHNLHSPTGFFDLRELPGLTASVAAAFVTLHDAWLLSGHCAHSFDCGRWETGCGECPDLSVYPAVRADATAFNWERKRDVLARCRLRVITPSQWLMERVERSILAPAVVEGAVVPNGVDLSVYKPGSRSDARASLMLPQDARVLLFAANGIRSNPFKDFATLREALSIVAERYHGPLILLALGEDCPDERVGAARIRFVPFQSDEEVVARYYRAADVYLHPARADTFPTSVLEAMACGRPVVGSAVGGIPEQVREGETGYLTAVGDARGMADAILTLLGDDERRRGMGERAAEVAREEYDVQRQVESVLGWYRRVLGR